MNLYRKGGSRGHWYIHWSNDGKNWFCLNFQYKTDMARTERALKEKGFILDKAK